MHRSRKITDPISIPTSALRGRSVGRTSCCCTDMAKTHFRLSNRPTATSRILATCYPIRTAEPYRYGDAPNTDYSRLGNSLMAVADRDSLYTPMKAHRPSMEGIHK